MSNKEKSLEELMMELEKISKELETENVSLEYTIKKFKEGNEIAKKAEKKLDEAEKSINVIISEDGKEEELKLD